MAQQDLPSLHDLIPFELALLLLFRRVYVEKMRMALRADLHLDGLAYVVSSLVPLYIYADGGVVRLLRAEELKGGLFADRGKRLYFLDGRTELRNFAITEEAVSVAMSSLLAARSQDAQST